MLTQADFPEMTKLARLTEGDASAPDTETFTSDTTGPLSMFTKFPELPAEYELVSRK